ncbi:hypothetical protein LCGC14_1242940 [marine sediment metagenome]|uniref:Uncharacterized protein n=1 Tax=marine sediment metagenome TaxID=412755 RepID=A0A0F9L5C7_9ZZZZ
MTIKAANALMEKRVYDPDLDGVIEVAELPAGLATEAEVTADIATHAGEADPHAAYQLESEKGAANGYAELDSGGDVPVAQIPDSIARDSELHTQAHNLDTHATRNHSNLQNIGLNDHAASDPVVGTAGLRTLGGGAQQAAPGNHAHTLAEDVLYSGVAQGLSGLAGSYARRSNPVAAGGDFSPAYSSQIFAAVSRAVAGATCYGQASAASALKIRVLMGGVQVAESTYISTTTADKSTVGTRALSGSRECRAQVHNYSGGSVDFYEYRGSTGAQKHSVQLVIGSIKL